MESPRLRHPHRHIGWRVLREDRSCPKQTSTRSNFSLAIIFPIPKMSICALRDFFGAYFFHKPLFQSRACLFFSKKYYPYGSHYEEKPFTFAKKKLRAKNFPDEFFSKKKKKEPKKKKNAIISQNSR